jgi:hypothetical protein
MMSFSGRGHWNNITFSFYSIRIVLCNCPRQKVTRIATYWVMAHVPNTLLRIKRPKMQFPRKSVSF